MSRRIPLLLFVVVAGLATASLPTHSVKPDTDARAQALLRIRGDGNWELLHGPTRLTRSRVAVSPLPLGTQDQPNAAAALRALSDAVAELRLEVRRAGEPDLTGLRIETAPLQPAQVLMQAVLVVSMIRLGDFELSADGRRDSIPLHVWGGDAALMLDETEGQAHSLVVDGGTGALSVVLQVHTTSWEEDADQPHDFEISSETDRVLDWSTPFHADGRMAQDPVPLLDVLMGVEHGLHRPRRITLRVMLRPTPTLPSRTLLDLLKIIVEQTPHQIDLTGFSQFIEWTR